MGEVIIDGRRYELPSAFDHVTYRVEDFSSSGYGEDEEPENRVVCPLEEANVISSELHGQPGRHSVVLDLDVPAKLIPSSTPGHFHLYIDTAMTWAQYQALLVAFADAGVLERGYVNASIKREHTALRLPWVRKENAVQTGEPF